MAFKRTIFVVLMAAVAAFSHARMPPAENVQGISARVIGISDGDTLTVLRENQEVRIRLANIDAPEKSQAFGTRSKQSLSDLCFGKQVAYQVKDIDQYGRNVAIVTCDGVEANRTQVERGLAWVYDRYNQDRSLPGLQARAKSEKRGLWADADPTPPWLYRRQK